ncbi:MAG: hypothetical protein ABSD88_06420 [Candidatus Korobacteraceae bacterium]
MQGTSTLVPEVTARFYGALLRGTARLWARGARLQLTHITSKFGRSAVDGRKVVRGYGVRLGVDGFSPSLQSKNPKNRERKIQKIEPKIQNDNFAQQE